MNRNVGKECFKAINTFCSSIGFSSLVSYLLSTNQYRKNSLYGKLPHNGNNSLSNHYHFVCMCVCVCVCVNLTFRLLVIAVMDFAFL